MERADWLDERVSSADARFLMVTAITHHRFNSPIWGAREVRKLQAELAEIARHAAEMAALAPLGNFDRLELQFDGGRIVAQARPDRLVFIAVANNNDDGP